jgi:hypothetical protein
LRFSLFALWEVNENRRDFTSRDGYFDEVFLHRAAGAVVCRNIVADSSAVLDGFIHVFCSTIAYTRHGIVVVDLVNRSNARATSHCACNGSDYGSDWATGQCANSCATQSACNSALCGVVVRIVVNSMLHIVICHVNHVSSEKFELATGLAETVPTLCVKKKPAALN